MFLFKRCADEVFNGIVNHAGALTAWESADNTNFRIILKESIVSLLARSAAPLLQDGCYKVSYRSSTTQSPGGYEAGLFSSGNTHPDNCSCRAVIQGLPRPYACFGGGNCCLLPLLLLLLLPGGLAGATCADSASNRLRKISGTSCHQYAAVIESVFGVCCVKAVFWDPLSADSPTLMPPVLLCAGRPADYELHPACKNRCQYP